MPRVIPQPDERLRQVQQQITTGWESVAPRLPAVRSGYTLLPSGQAVPTPVAPAPMSQPLGMGGAPQPAAETPWFADPDAVLKLMESVNKTTSKKKSDVDSKALQDIQVKQAQQLAARNDAAFDARQSSLAGYLGGLNMNQSGLGMQTLANANDAHFRSQQEGATNLAEVLARNQLDDNRFRASLNRDDVTQNTQLALGLAQLGMDWQQQQAANALAQGRLGLDTQLGLGNLGIQQGQLGLQGQQLANQNQQFFAGQDFASQQAALDRHLQLGVLAAQQQFQGGQNDAARQHETELQQLGAQNQLLAQQAQQAFQQGMLQMQQQFQAQQTQATQGFQGQQALQAQAHERDMQAAQLSQQLQVTLAQLADAAAGRTLQSQQIMGQLSLQAQQLAAQIEQNRSENALQSQQMGNQFALGMGGLNLQAAQLGQQNQQAMYGNQLQLLGLTRQGLDPNHPLVQGMMGQMGMPVQQQPGGSLQPMTFEQFANQQYQIPLSWHSRPYQMGDPVDRALQQAKAGYGQYMQQFGGGQLWGMPQMTWQDVNQQQQLNNQAIGNQMDFALGMNQLAARYGGGQMGPAARNETANNLPLVANRVIEAGQTGSIPSGVSRAETKYWLGRLPQMGLMSPDAAKQILQNILKEGTEISSGPPELGRSFLNGPPDPRTLGLN